MPEIRLDIFPYKSYASLKAVEDPGLMQAAKKDTTTDVEKLAESLAYTFVDIPDLVEGRMLSY